VGYPRRSGEPLSDVSHHVKALERTEVIQILEPVQRQSTMEHRYRIAGACSALALATVALLAAP
jgi:hypothetical protein